MAVGACKTAFTPSTGVRIPLGTPNEVKGLHENATLFCLYVGQIYPLSASTEFFILFFSWVVQSRDCPPLKADAASGPCKAGSATAHSTACASYRNPLECGAAVRVQTGPDGFRILVSNMGVMQDFPSPFSASCILSLCCQSFLRFLPNCRISMENKTEQSGEKPASSTTR